MRHGRARQCRRVPRPSICSKKIRLLILDGITDPFHDKTSRRRAGGFATKPRCEGMGW
jgi:hypothetical protein